MNRIQEDLADYTECANSYDDCDDHNYYGH